MHEQAAADPGQPAALELEPRAHIERDLLFWARISRYLGPKQQIVQGG